MQGEKLRCQRREARIEFSDLHLAGWLVRHACGRTAYEYWWRAVGDNHEIMAASQLLTTKQSAEHSIATVQAEAASAPVHDQSEGVTPHG